MSVYRWSSGDAYALFSALCHHFNVQKALYPADTPLLPTFDMRVLRDAHMPTHILAMSSADPNDTAPPLMAPINADMYNRGFRVEILPSPPPGTASPVPYQSPKGQVVTLPVVSISVPHVASIPLLLLFGLGLETQSNYLSCWLLPPDVIEEFPNAAAMSQVMSRLSEEKFKRHMKFNQGIWQNVLSLGLQDTSIVALIQTAWNVTAEARRIRQRSLPSW